MESRIFRTGVLLLKFEFKFEQNRKVSWTCVKVTPLNRLEYYKILGVGIISFGPIFFSVKMFEIITEKKKEKKPCASGPEWPQCTAQGIQPSRSGASARTSGFQT